MQKRTRPMTSTKKILWFPTVENYDDFIHGSCITQKELNRGEARFAHDITCGNTSLLAPVVMYSDSTVLAKLMSGDLKDSDMGDENLNYDDCILLRVASVKGRTDIVKKLLENGSNPNVKVRGWMSPLEHSIVSGNLEMIRVLVKHGAELTKEVSDLVKKLFDVSVESVDDIAEVIILNSVHSE